MKFRLGLCVAPWLQAWDLVSGWDGEAGGGDLLLSSPSHLSLSWRFAFQTPCPNICLDAGMGLPGGAFNTFPVQGSLHNIQAGK